MKLSLRASSDKMVQRDADVKSRVLNSWLVFWLNLDRSLHSQLHTEYDSHCTSFSGASIFGLALATAQSLEVGYREKTLSYITAAAQTSCIAARGLLGQISRACGSESNSLPTDDLDEGHQMLFEAAASGSFTALWQLRRLSTILEKQAWHAFRKNGGFNGSVSPIGLSPARSALQGDEKIARFHEAAVFGTREDIFRHVDPSKINELDSEGLTALNKAARAGNSETLKALVELDADASITTTISNISCLHWLFMFESGSMEAVVQMLCSRSANLGAIAIHQGDENRWPCQFEHFPFIWPVGTPFHWACFTRSFPAMQTLLQAGVDIDELEHEQVGESNRAQTPLGMAMYRGDVEVVRFLLEHGANPNFVDGRLGRNPLHMLAMNTMFRFPIVPKCLYWWCNHGAQDTHIELVSECVNLVVAAGGNINARGLMDDTPLKTAIDSNDGGVTLALLNAGADTSIRGNFMQLPIHQWVSKDGRKLIYPSIWEPVLRLLIDRSPQTNETDISNCNVFHYAARNNSFVHFKHAMEILLESPLHQFASHRDKCSSSVLENMLRWSKNAGEDTELRLQFLLDHEGAVDMKKENIGYLMWLTCRNATLSSETCLSIIKRLQEYEEPAGHDVLVTNRYGRKSDAGRGTSVLMAAVSNAQLATVKFLLRPSTDLQLPCSKNMSLLDHALHEAEKGRQLGLSRWSRHAPRGEPPRHRGQKSSRDPSNFNELFWYRGLSQQGYGESDRSEMEPD